MHIKYNDKELLDSMTFMSFGNGETEIEFGEGKEKLKVILDFIDEEEPKEQKLQFVVIDQHTLKIMLTNWNNVLGTTFNEAVKIGSFRKRELFLILNVKKAGQKAAFREVTFSLYVGQEVHDGKN